MFHTAVAERFPSGGSSTSSGFVPHISTVYANSDSASNRCVTQYNIRDLWGTLDSAGVGLHEISPILAVPRIGLWDMQDKTATEWIRLQDWPIGTSCERRA